MKEALGSPSYGWKLAVVMVKAGKISGCLESCVDANSCRVFSHEEK